MFDLAKVAQPEVDAPLEKRQIGGLGVYLMRRVMDQVELRPAPSGKELVLVKRRPRQEAVCDAD
jgi:anti-sigma regulatory factor (Ser/Thr protein kinase)